jgi:hypothetical protein
MSALLGTGLDGAGKPGLFIVKSRQSARRGVRRRLGEIMGFSIVRPCTLPGLERLVKRRSLTRRQDDRRFEHGGQALVPVG